MSTDESWRPVVGYEAFYEVSNMGRVRRTAPGRGTVAGKVLLPSGGGDSRRYLTVGLTVNGEKRSARVHTLVMEAFGGPRPEGMECRHLNGDRHDPRAANLAWGTSRENAADRKTHGTDPVGERCGAAKLTDAAVRAIRERCASGEQQRALAAEFNVSAALICKIVKRQAWQHLPAEPGDAGYTPRAARPRKNNESFRHRLSGDIVRQIREMRAAGVTGRELAERFSISTAMVSDIVTRKVWRSIE